VSVQVLRGNALALPLADNTIDLVVTSPPYFGLRSYQDAGEHYDGQLGSEATPAEFVDALICATREMVRVVKPSGSIWVNLGDKYGTTSPPGSGGKGPASRIQTTHPGSYTPDTGSYARPRPGVPPKSLIGVPWRYALACIDDLGLILRAEVIWSKPNGLPESVTDRVRRSHETWFHFTLNPRYYSAVDEIREEYSPNQPWGVRTLGRVDPSRGDHGQAEKVVQGMHPLGKLPGSVWTIPTQPLTVPPELGVDHFAAFPMEWPRRIVTGWSPREVCMVCGQGRRPVVSSVGLDMSRPQARRAQELADRAGLTEEHLGALLSVGVSDTGRGAATQNGTGKNTAEIYALANVARTALGGYSREYLLRRPTGFTSTCACPHPTAPTTPGIVLDPFGGTGTTALVAHALGRHGISIDMSADYCRLAQWRTTDPQQLARAQQREYVPPREQVTGQETLFEGLGA
jgi:DNA modification methylase